MKLSIVSMMLAAVAAAVCPSRAWAGWSTERLTVLSLDYQPGDAIEVVLASRKPVCPATSSNRARVGAGLSGSSRRIMVAMLKAAMNAGMPVSLLVDNSPDGTGCTITSVTLAR